MSHWAAFKIKATDQDVGRSAYRGAERHLKNIAVAPSAIQEVLAGVKGHRHDTNIKEDRQQHLPGGYFPDL